MSTKKCDICNCESTNLSKVTDFYDCIVLICDDLLCWKTFCKEVN